MSCKKQTPPTDAQIKERIVGAWKPSGDKLASLKFDGDGSFHGREKSVLVAGTWSVQNGLITLSITSSSVTNHLVEKAQVVRMDKHEMVFQPMNETNLSVFKRN